MNYGAEWYQLQQIEEEAQALEDYEFEQHVLETTKKDDDD